MNIYYNEAMYVVNTENKVTYSNDMILYLTDFAFETDVSKRLYWNYLIRIVDSGHVNIWSELVH